MSDSESTPESSGPANITSVRGLFDFYLSVGCPCRFPRFRRTVEVALPEGVASHDINGLVAEFDRRLPVRDRSKKQGDVWTCRCALCDSRIVRTESEAFRDSFVDRAEIELQAGVIDLGAAVSSPIPLFSGLHAAAPGIRKERIEEAAMSFPHLSELDWLAYLSKLR